MLLAVMDLGSNSFKMTVAQWSPELSRSQPFRILHKERHPIQLGAAVFSKGIIPPGDMREALKALSKMQARLRDFSAPILRVVATSAIRDARNGRHFVGLVKQKLGIPIEVISGIEEARLIARGLEWEYPKIARGLLVDIGGGSTEVASFGKGWSDAFCHSFRLGSVRLKREADVEVMRKTIRAQLRISAPRRVEKLIGSAGSIQSLGRILSGSRSTPLVRKSTLDRWIAENFNRGPNALRSRYNLTPSRARVVMPGAVILSEILEWLQLPELTVTGMTLRDGVLVDLVAAWQSEEAQILRKGASARNALRKNGDKELLRFLESVVGRFHTDLAHGRHMAGLSTSLFDQMVAAGYPFGAEERRYLVVASFLHDVGKIVSEAAHHKHSAYIIRNMEIPGLSPLEWKKCALIALYHRKDTPPKKDPLPGGVGGIHSDQVRRLTALLRLADGLDDDHSQNIDSAVLRLNKKQALIELIQIKSDPMNIDYFREKASYFEELFGLKIVTYVHPRRLAR